jgi:hypothetical protein
MVLPKRNQCLVTSFLPGCYGGCYHLCFLRRRFRKAKWPAQLTASEAEVKPRFNSKAHTASSLEERLRAARKGEDSVSCRLTQYNKT